MWTLNLFHYSPDDENGGMLGPPFPVVHNHLFCLDHVEGEVVVLAPHGQVSDLLPIGCLIVVGGQIKSNHSLFVTGTEYNLTVKYLLTDSNQ